MSCMTYIQGGMNVAALPRRPEDNFQSGLSSSIFTWVPEIALRPLHQVLYPVRSVSGHLSCLNSLAHDTLVSLLCGV